MAIEVLAKEAGVMVLGPGMRRQRVREGERVLWHWPTEGEDAPKLPKKWIVLRKVDGEELERRMSGGPPRTAQDPQRRKGQTKNRVATTERGYTPEDQAIIAAAMECLDEENQDHWTAKNLPDIQAVREQFERIEMRDTGDRNWPSWLTREMCEAVGSRNRGDPIEEADE